MARRVLALDISRRHGTVAGAFVIVGETFPYKPILLAVLGYCAMMVAAMRLHHRFGDRFVEREW